MMVIAAHIHKTALAFGASWKSIGFGTYLLQSLMGGRTLTLP
jgi:hypothetical protein